MNKTIFQLGLAICMGLSLLPPVRADDGHNHDHGPATSEVTASPRFEAQSDLFELVGVRDKPGQLKLYLDRFATNEPVSGAKIEFEAGAEKGVAAAQPDGTYLLKLAALDQPGQIPFSFTVTAGSDTDLLAGELALGEERHDHEHEAASAWRRWAAFAVSALALATLALFARKRLGGRRQGERA